MATKHKIVNKPWGHELWIENGSSTPYALKKIFFKEGNKTSLQVHQYKIETNFVISGHGIFLISKERFDIDAYLNNTLTEDAYNKFLETISEYPLEPGISYTIHPGYVHRVIATTDLTFIESSTNELDDVIRLQDDTGRPHGKINEEHK